MGLSNEITPEESVSPIYLVPITSEQTSEIASISAPSPEEMKIEQDILRQAAINKLVALGLTEDEALAVIGNGS